MKMNQGIILSGFLMIVAVQGHAIEDLKIQVLGSDVVLDWPSVPGGNYIIQHRADFAPGSSWITLSNPFPAAVGTNRTSFTHVGAVQLCGSAFAFAEIGNNSLSVQEDSILAVPWWNRWQLERRDPSLWELAIRPPLPWEARDWEFSFARQSLLSSIEPSGLADESFQLSSGCEADMGFYRVLPRMRVEAWGNNSYGAATVSTNLTNAVAVSAGAFFSVVANHDGSLVSWGRLSGIYPTQLTNATWLESGEYHTLAVVDEGKVIGMGDTGYGQTPAPVGLSNVKAVSGGAYHSLALKNDGTLVGWGENSFGQTNVPVGLTNVIAISCSRANHNLALRNDGTVVAWGANNFGQATVPSGLTNVIAIAAGEEHSLALKSNNTVVGWGSNGSGRATPPAGLTNVVAISAGEVFSAALRNDGTVVTWGSIAPPPAGLSNVVSISSGGFHIMVLKLDL